MKASKRAVVLQRGIVAGIITVFVLMFGVVSPLTAAEFTLKGETVSLIIGFPPGSGDDVGMRQLVPFLEKNLPGNPTVIVINKPGAGGMLAANSFYATTKGDGKSIGMFTGFALNVALKDESVKFDIDKMHLLGIESTNQVTLISNTTGVKTAADLLTVKEPLMVGTSSKRNAAYAANVSFFDILGIPHKDLTGYAGAAALLQAIRTKELSVAPYPWTLYVARKESLMQEGLVTAVSQRGYLKGDGTVVAEPVLGVPTQHEIVQQLKPEAIGTPEYKAMTFFVGLFAVTRSFWLPPETDPQIVSVWQRALKDTYLSAEYQDTMKKQTKMDIIFHNAEDGRKLFDNIFTSFNDPVVRKAIEKSLGM